MDVTLFAAGHLLGVLPALSMSSFSGAAVYLSGFCAGTLTAMSLFTFSIGEISVRLRKRAGPDALITIGRIASCFAITVGLYMLWNWTTETIIEIPEAVDAVHSVPG